MRENECPKCGEAMEYHAAEPDVGILASGFECCACGHVIITEDEDVDWLDRESPPVFP